MDEDPMKLTTLALVLFLTAAPAAWSQTNDRRFAIIAGAQWMERTGETAEGPPPPPGTVRWEGDLDSGGGVALALRFALNRQLALEFRASAVEAEMEARVRTATDAEARFALGTIRAWPLTAVIQYHFPTTRRFRPYLGGGGGYVILQDPADERLPSEITAVELANTLGLVVNAGFDYSFTDRLFLNADARYMPLETRGQIRFVGPGDEQNLRVNPVIVSAGLGYRF
jgi:outer membrane protein W